MIPAAETLRAAVDLPPVAGSAAAARRLVGQLLDAWAAEGFRDDATLLVSELVTNVVRHVTGEVAMRVEVALTAPAPTRSALTFPARALPALTGPGLQVAVVDSSAARPVLRTPGPHGGHGLGLVAVVADRWGSEDHGAGKRVWFELAPRGRGRGSVA
jgi:hypothetical protein